MTVIMGQMAMSMNGWMSSRSSFRTIAIVIAIEIVELSGKIIMSNTVFDSVVRFIVR